MASRVMIGIIVTLVVLSVGTFVLLSVYRDSSSCYLVRNIPKSNATNIRNIASSDYRSLANFLGYLEYNMNTSDNTFMPLNLLSISQNRCGDGVMLELLADCAAVSIYMLPDRMKNITKVMDITVKLVLPNGYYSKCFINTSEISFKNNRHYDCKQERRYCCKISDESVDGHYRDIAILGVQDFEFEIGGDVSSIKRGMFNTKADNC